MTPEPGRPFPEGEPLMQILHVTFRNMDPPPDTSSRRPADTV